MVTFTQFRVDDEIMSNRARGADFARSVGDYLAQEGYKVTPEFPVCIGLNGRRKKSHNFDYGNESLIGECKRYDWTEGGNSPSAKISTLNEAIMYFHAAPKHYRKMLFIASTGRKGTKNPETFAEYYVRLNGHFISDDIEVWELSVDAFKARRIET